MLGSSCRSRRRSGAASRAGGLRRRSAARARQSGRVPQRVCDGTRGIGVRSTKVDSTIFVDTYDLPPQRETRDGKTVWTLKGENSKNEPVSMAKEE
jgi:hypothetical protein